METTNSYVVQFRGLWLWPRRELFLLQVEQVTGEYLWFRLEEDVIESIVKNGVALLRDTKVGFVIRQSDEPLRRDIQLDLDGPIPGTSCEPRLETQDFSSVNQSELERSVGAIADGSATLCLVFVTSLEDADRDICISREAPEEGDSFSDDFPYQAPEFDDDTASSVGMETWNGRGDEDSPVVTGICFESSQLSRLCHVGIELLRLLGYEFEDEEFVDDECVED